MHDEERKKDNGAKKPSRNDILQLYAGTKPKSYKRKKISYENSKTRKI